MKINRMIVIGLVATSLLASCKKNNGTEGNAPENGFRAIIEQTGGDGSRTHIDPQSWANGTTDLLWTADDLIKVANNGGASGCQTLTYQLTEGENTTNGTFYTGEEHETFFTPDYVSIYPAFNADDVANTLSGTTATFNLPAVQTYKANSFAEKSMPMVAYSSDQTLPFKNVLGGICFPIVCTSPSPVQVTSVVLTSKANEALWGTCTTTISTSGGDPTSEVANSNAAKNVITLDCSGSTVTLDPDEPTYFCIMVPPGSLANGFTVEAYSGSTKVFDESTTNNNLGADFIPRSVIRKVNQNLQIVVHSLTVTTISPTFITTNSALGLGAVDPTPATCGILYALASDLATPADDLVVGGNNVTNLPSSAVTVVAGTRRFDASLTGLDEDKIYYVRAYATNEVGTVSYGDPVPFATRYDYYSETNKGKSRSTFTVNENGDKVRFSMGNLQYQGSTSTWRFAEYQYEYVGDDTKGYVYENGQHPNSSLDGTKSDNGLIAENYSGWIDLFGWGTSGINGYTPIATYWQPWSTSTSYPDYNPYGYAYANLNTNVNGNGGKADWGYNAISNGGNQAGNIPGRIAWRTLQGYTKDDNTAEWNYLLNTRTCNYHRYAQVQLKLRGTSDVDYAPVNEVPACGDILKGLIVFPDSFTWPAIVHELTTLDGPSVYGVNNLTEAQWSLLEQQGAIFLPSAGFRNGTTVNSLEIDGDYWSSTYQNYQLAYELTFNSGIVRADNYYGRGNGMSVRLVCPAE